MTTSNPPFAVPDESAPGTPNAMTRARYASALVGFAGLSVLALLLGVSPLEMWPFVSSVAMVLCALMLTQGRSVLGIAVVGAIAGALWVYADGWRTGHPSFMGWMVPMASYTVLLLVFHHTTLLRVAIARAGCLNHDIVEENESRHLDPSAEAAEAFLYAFNRWHRDWADQDDPWPAFWCFLRENLLERIGARQVRVYRVVADGDQLLPLSGTTDDNDHDPGSGDARAAEGPSTQSKPSLPWSRKRQNPRLQPPWKPIRIDNQVRLEGHVISTKHAYIQGCQGQGEKIRALAERSVPPVVWCFPVIWGEEVIGLVEVGYLPRRALKDPATLRLYAEMLSMCWNRVQDVHELGIARRTDLASGVLSRTDFLTVAGHALADSCSAREPVTVLALALEGPGSSDDDVQWDFRDRHMRMAGRILNRRLHADDVIGRFTDDRFVVMLHRVDTAMGQRLAVKLRQSILHALAAEVNDSDTPSGTSTDASPAASLDVRCALVGGQWPGSADDARQMQSRLHDWVGQAFSLLDVARVRKQNVITETHDESLADPEDAASDEVLHELTGTVG